jgi:type IV pilus assembly protein PilC
MTIFAYQVRDAKGATASGVVNANDVNEASRMLRNEGHVIVDLHEQGATEARADAGQAGARRRRIRRDEVIYFANQLAVMVDTGVSLADALDSIALQAESEQFKAVMTDVSSQVKGGVEFSAALAKYPKLFGRLFVAMVRASEASGTMGKMLQRVAKYLEKERQIRRRIRGAMTYPVAMLCFCILVVTGMLIFVLPRFERIYAGKSAVLPLPTRALLALSNGLATWWHVILLILAAVAIGLHLFFRRPEGRETLDQARLNLPVVGRMMRRGILARSLRTLATMVASGVSMLDSLEITAEVSGNILYERVWRALAEKLKEGASLSEEMTHYELMPQCVSQMVAAGERTGKLATVLDRVAEFCEEDLDTSVRTATSFIEPVMIIAMGAIVGGLALALLLPVFSLSRIVAG